MHTIPATILAQLGGSRFLAMTGAKDLVGSDEALQLRISGRTSGRPINKVKISLMGDDTYSVQTFALRGVECRLIGWRHDVYAENLREVFERLTGLYTSL